MRTISFILAFAVLFLGPSVADSSGTANLPGIGTFEFNGTTPVTQAPMVVAAIR